MEQQPPTSPPGTSALPCPGLPLVPGRLDASITRRHGTDRGPAFYHDALAYAQSHWLHGNPAQAILQLNKAWLADLAPADPILRRFPPPYHALAEILTRAADGSHGFLGNPVRHFQHLASRMTGPRSIARTWRAWTCHHLSRHTLPPAAFPPDGSQLIREGLWIPTLPHALVQLAIHGWPGEAAEALRAFPPHLRPSLPTHL